MSAKEAEKLANFPLLLYPAFPCKNIEEIILTPPSLCHQFRPIQQMSIYRLPLKCKLGLVEKIKNHEVFEK